MDMDEEAKHQNDYVDGMVRTTWPNCLFLVQTRTFLSIGFTNRESAQRNYWKNKWISFNSWIIRIIFMHYHATMHLLPKTVPRLFHDCTCPILFIEVISILYTAFIRTPYYASTLHYAQKVSKHLHKLRFLHEINSQ